MIYIKKDKIKKKNLCISSISILNDDYENFLVINEKVENNIVSKIREKVENFEENIKIENRLNEIAKKIF